jgi:hypothetical protein
MGREIEVATLKSIARCDMRLSCTFSQHSPSYLLVTDTSSVARRTSWCKVEEHWNLRKVERGGELSKKQRRMGDEVGGKEET